MICSVCHQDVELPEWEDPDLYREYDEVSGGWVSVCSDCFEQVVLRNFAGGGKPGNEPVLLGKESEQIARDEYEELE